MRKLIGITTAVLAAAVLPATSSQEPRGIA